MYHHVLKTIMKCSKCKSTDIVAPCNEELVLFRCVACGHEQRNDPWEEKKETTLWESDNKVHEILI